MKFDAGEGETFPGGIGCNSCPESQHPVSPGPKFGLVSGQIWGPTSLPSSCVLFLCSLGPHHTRPLTTVLRTALNDKSYADGAWQVTVTQRVRGMSVSTHILAPLFSRASAPGGQSADSLCSLAQRSELWGLNVK